MEEHVAGVERFALIYAPAALLQTTIPRSAWHRTLRP